MNLFKIKRLLRIDGFKIIIKHLCSDVKKFFYDIFHFGLKIAHYNFWGDFTTLNVLPESLNERIKKKTRELNNDFLLKRFKNFIEGYKYKEFGQGKMEKKIRVLWWQGLDKAPEIVKICVNSIKKHNCGYEVIILDKNNYKNYIKLPDFILRKVKKGEMTITHFSEIIRMGLLKEYGGIRVDATMYINSDFLEKFNNMNFNSSYISFNSIEKWCSFLLGGKSNNRIFHFCYDFLVEYNKYFKKQINYFLIDYAIQICYLKFKDCREDIENINIQNDEVFSHNFGENYSEVEWNNLMKEIPFFKLTNKWTYSEHSRDGKLTNYGKFLTLR